MAALPDKFNPNQIRNRLLAKVSIVPFSGCWIWTGAVNNQGYGQTMVGRKNHWLVHRLMWTLSGRPLTDSQHLMHHCDTPCCVNPDHLDVATHKQNMRDMANKGRHRMPNLRGENHPAARLTASDVVAIRSSLESSSIVAARYGVAAAHIRGIRRGKFWGSV